MYQVVLKNFLTDEEIPWSDKYATMDEAKAYLDGQCELLENRGSDPIWSDNKTIHVIKFSETRYSHLVLEIVECEVQ